MDDFPLYRRMRTDPGMMAELRGPLPDDGLLDTWQEVLDSVCVWDREWNGKPITEFGWMVMPEHQSRGVASAAVREVLDCVRSGGRRTVIHAFPGVTNGASNAICRRAGFEQLEIHDFAYAGRLLRCNHWRVDMRTEPAPSS